MCGSDLQRGHSGDGLIGKCCFGVMYCEWYGVCDFVVLSVVEVCADYSVVNVFHVFLYGVGVCVNVCGVACFVVCYYKTATFIYAVKLPFSRFLRHTWVKAVM